MRHPALPLLLIALPLLAACAGDGKPASGPGRAMLQGTACLDPDLARSWHYLDSDSLLVDAGRRKYRIQVGDICTELALAPVIAFKGSGIGDHICGHVGEQVLVRSRNCRIDGIELLDEEAWRQATAGRDGKRVDTGDGD